MIKLLCVFGTRPEAIKMALVIKAFEKRVGQLEYRICVTAQHREMLDQVLRLFDIKPDFDLDIMREDQTLFDVTARGLHLLERVLKDEVPDGVIVQGDTTTAFVASLAAYYLKIPVGHVEAGLRTKDKYSPFPEEMNRRLIDAKPTEQKRLQGRLEKEYDLRLADQSVILVTGHRRESFGEGFERICQGLRMIAERNAGVDVVYPVHLNPRVREPVRRVLSGLENVHLIEPLDYETFVYLMNRAYLILTDSGGIQEEAPSLGKPVLVMREVTERPEAIEAGTARLVGTDSEAIWEATQTLLDDRAEYERMAHIANPFGDGKAAERITRILLEGAWRT